MAIDAAIAMNRFSLGASAGEKPPANPQDWLLEQVLNFDAEPPVISALPQRTALAEQLTVINKHRKEFNRAKAEGLQKDIPLKFSPRLVRRNYAQAISARLESAVATDTGFPERLVHFWSNHFAVSVGAPPVTQFAGDYEFNAIRPHIKGSFAELLVAAETHPAMLTFLNQTRSVGPDSPIGRRMQMRNRGRQFGLNENLGRETMELHTLGVRTGYTQADVIEMAKAYTGLTVADMPGSFNYLLRSLDYQPGETIFVDALHEPGTRTIIGKKYPQQGRDQIAAVLYDLGTHPATAHHISFQLARHFVADNPPPALVKRMTADFMRTGGNLMSLYQVMVTAPEAWEQPFSKFKSPWEWVVSTLRLTGMDSLPRRRNGPIMMPYLFNRLGQAIWKPGSPAGYGDTEQDWAGSGALMQRVNMAATFSERVADRIDARKLAAEALPGVLTENTRESIARAANPAQGLSLLLLAPEFLRR